MKREYSKATEFAKEFVKTKKEELASKLKLKTPENIAIPRPQYACIPSFFKFI